GSRDPKVAPRLAGQPEPAHDGAQPRAVDRRKLGEIEHEGRGPGLHQLSDLNPKSRGRSDVQSAFETYYRHSPVALLPLKFQGFLTMLRLSCCRPPLNGSAVAREPSPTAGHPVCAGRPNRSATCSAAHVRTPERQMLTV